MAGEVEVLARGWTIYVDKFGRGTNYVRIGGLKTLTLSSSKKDAQITDFEDQGQEAHLVATRTKEIKLVGNYLENAMGVQDQGQADMEWLAEQIGAASLGRFKLVSPSGKERSFMGSVVIDDVGGNVDEATGWGATITRSGPDL